MLLPGEKCVRPFEDATRLLDDPVELRQRAEEAGYLYLPGLLPEARVARVRAFARAAFAERGWVEPEVDNPPRMKAVEGARLQGRGWDDPHWVGFQYRFSESPALTELAEDARVMKLLGAVMGEPPWVAATNFCWLKLPGSPEHTTLPHQDLWYLPRCPGLWTVWVPLVDTPFEVGPLAVLPGSHRQGLWHHENAYSGIRVPPDAEWASNEVRAGDVVCFSALTVHCAWSNVSTENARVSADIRFEPRSTGDGSVLRPPSCEPPRRSEDGR